MKKIINIVVLILLVLVIGIVLGLPTPLIIFGIWFIINIFTTIEKNKAKSKKNDKNTTVVGSSEDDTALRKLRQETSSKGVIEEDNTVIKEYQSHYNNEEKILQEQMIYNNKLSDIKSLVSNIKKPNADITIPTQQKNRSSQKNIFLSTLSVEQAIIYNAMLNPKKLNYKFKPSNNNKKG